MNLRNLSNIRNLLNGGRSAVLNRPYSFSFNGTNGYIQQVGYSGGVVRKQNDGSRDYWQCYGGYFNIGDSAVHGLDNRSVQTQKFVFQLDDMLNVVNLSGYNSLLSVSVLATGAIQVETQGTGSARLVTTQTVTAGNVNSVIVRVNNSLPTGTARVVGDIDVFINGTKATLGITAIGNNTTTSSILYWGAYNSTTTLFRGRLYNFSLWNRALSDAECQAEGLSNRSVVTSSGLVNTWDTTDTSQAISRTGYNLTVQGNVSVGTDGDGKYINFNGNRDGTASTGTEASIFNTSSAVFNQNTSFTIKTKIKVNTLPANNITGIFASYNDFGIYFGSAGQLIFRTNGTGGGTYTHGTAMTLGQVMDLHMVFDAPSNKFYAYINGTLVNTGGTTAGTFATLDRYLGDGGRVSTGAGTSCNKYIYHARTRARALTQSEINADIALGNNTNNDPTIVASYRPDNLINWQGILSQDNMNIAPWSKSSATVTSGRLDHEGGATGNRIVWAATPANVQQNVTSLTGASLASKQLTVKMMVKSNTGSAQTARLRCQHITVGDFLSGDLTIPTTWTEITFSATFTSATTGTGIAVGLVSSTTNTALDAIVSKPRIFLGNEILYDNSPNIGGYVGPLTNRYIGGWIRPGVDAINDANGNPIMNLGYGYGYIRDTTNLIRIRYDNRIGGIENFSALGTGFRNRIPYIGGIERDGTAFRTVLCLNGVLIARTALSYLDAQHALSQIQVWLGRASTRYFTGSMRDMRIFTSPTAITNDQILMITNGGDPMDVTKVLHRDALPSDTTNYVTDKSGNGRVGYITGGVTKTF